MSIQQKVWFLKPQISDPILNYLSSYHNKGLPNKVYLMQRIFFTPQNLQTYFNSKMY